MLSKLYWTVGPVTMQSTPGPRKEADFMLQLTDSQKCSLSISPVDAKGQPAPVQGVPTWASSVPATAAVTADVTGLTAEIVAGTPGIAQVTVSVIPVGGDGVTPITGTLDVTVTGGEATTITITAGTPVAQ